MRKLSILLSCVLLSACCLCYGQEAVADDLEAGSGYSQQAAPTAVKAKPNGKKAKAKLKACEKLEDKIDTACDRLQLKKAKKLYSKLVRTVAKLKKMAKAEPSFRIFYKEAKEIKSDCKDSIKDLKKALAKQRKAANRLRFLGVVYSGGWRYTWYSQNVLPGGGLSIPGRHVGNAGLIMDKRNRVCVASSSHRKGTVLNTPYGKAKVYDSGCDYGTIDVYTNW